MAGSLYACLEKRPSTLLGLRGAATVGTNATEGYFVTGDLEAHRHLDLGLVPASLNVDIEGPATRIAIKVMVLTHVGAIARRPTLDVHLPHEPALHKGLQAVVHRRQRDLGHLPLGTDEYFLGAGMIALLQQHIVNVPPLHGKPQARPGQAFIQALVEKLDVQLLFHAGEPKPYFLFVKTWNNSKYNYKPHCARHRYVLPHLPMKFLVRWIFRILVIVLVLGAVAILCKDVLLKELAEKRLRDATGLDVHIARIEFGLFSPVLHAEGIRLYNPPEFGGGLFIDLPELHVEYDRDALSERRLKLHLVRVNLAEIDIVDLPDGRSNVDVIQQNMKLRPRPPSLAEVTFDGLETLNLTLGEVRQYNLGAQDQAQVTHLGIKNEVFKGLKTETDVILAAGKIAWRVGMNTMFSPPTRPKAKPPAKPIAAPTQALAPAPAPVRPR